MSALEALLTKDYTEYTALEAAVVFLYGKHPDDATDAAAELQALHARLADAEAKAERSEAENEKARKVVKAALEVIDEHEMTDSVWEDDIPAFRVRDERSDYRRDAALDDLLAAVQDYHEARRAALAADGEGEG